MYLKRDEVVGVRIAVGNAHRNYCRERETSRSIIDELLPTVRECYEAQLTVPENILRLCESATISNAALAKLELKLRKAERRLLKAEGSLMRLEKSLYCTRRSPQVNAASSITSSEEKRLKQYDYELVSSHSEESCPISPETRNYLGSIDQLRFCYDRITTFEEEDPKASKIEMSELISDYLRAKEEVYSLYEQYQAKGINLGWHDLSEWQLDLRSLLAEGEISSINFIVSKQDSPMMRIENWLSG